MMPHEIPLTQGVTAIVDPIDFRAAMKHKWCLTRRRRNNAYAMCRVKRGGRWTGLLLHRLLMNAPAGVQVDHINGNGLDCRRTNMRLATHADNIHNQRSDRGGSRFKGVSWHKAARKWVSQICCHRVKHHLGLFDTEVAAAEAYDTAAKRLHGDFARLNFPTPNDTPRGEMRRELLAEVERALANQDTE